MTKCRVVMSAACLLAPLVLAGCGTNWVRPGATPTMRDAALARCHAVAYTHAPSAMNTVMISPGSYMTDKNGKSGTYIPPSYSTRDSNDGARTAIIRDCMYRDGWTPS